MISRKSFKTKWTWLLKGRLFFAATFGFIAALLMIHFQGNDLRTNQLYQAKALIPDDATSDEFRQAVDEYLADQEDLQKPHETSYQVEVGSTIAQALADVGFSNTEAQEIISTGNSVRNLGKVPSGLRFRITWQNQSSEIPLKIAFDFTPTQTLQIERGSDHEQWNAQWIERPVIRKSQTFSGIVINHLWDSATEAGMDPQLVVELASVFAWQIDFNREVRPDDRWRIVVEKLFVNDEFVGWGNILASEYENNGQLYTAVRFPKEGDRASFYAPDGSSLRRMFLKSPIKFGRISSRFKTARFHPILRRNMPHNGVDYAAPTGTPVMSVGKGTVELAGLNGGSGIMVKIRHNSTYTTAYLHLQRVAKGIRQGRKVEQGTVIGYVGATGLATGPHLHFAFYENGRFVDPLGKKFPSADPVPDNEMPDFQSIASELIRTLPAWAQRPDNLKMAL